MKEIDLATWDRKEIFEFFSTIDYPFFSNAMQIDVTKVKDFSKEKSLSFYLLMVWLTTKSINSVPAFRVKIVDDKVYRVDRLAPGFTMKNDDNDMFKLIDIDWDPDIYKFIDLANNKYENQSTFVDSTQMNKDKVCITSIPWFTLTSGVHAHNTNTTNTTTQICFSKYYLENDRLKMNIIIDANHRIVDSYQISKFLDTLALEISKL